MKSLIKPSIQQRREAALINMLSRNDVNIYISNRELLELLKQEYPDIFNINLQTFEEGFWRKQKMFCRKMAIAPYK
ncbi:hypothetical protein [Fangia hongkongensis]|uniref:hypothetical protein n=1 Tax=Fangia hongkongensis TaxID=270495 RepID=UPI0003643C8E|nr:hypothetical protein [Fangia hongkongensis]